MNVMILGCGQLSRLMALEGKALNYEFTFVAIENEPTDCVEGLGQIVRWNRNMSVDSLLQVSGIPDVVTVERENIDSQFLFELSLQTKMYPRPEAVSTCQNRLKEKLALSKLNVPATPWLPVNDKFQLESAVVGYGFPVVIKAYNNGYDGKNQWHIHKQAELDELLENEEPVNWIVEPKIDFQTEASIIAARSVSGEITLYPITENFHQSGILRRSIAPIDGLSEEKAREIKNAMIHILESWKYVGVLTMEVFITEHGFMINELAPRVHNSGHWTLNQSITSQFENHLRAITDKPLGSTRSDSVNGMLNILGGSNLIEVENNFEGELVMYNKANQLGRKLGHLNFVDSCRHNLLSKMAQAESRI